MEVDWSGNIDPWPSHVLVLWYYMYYTVQHIFKTTDISLIHFYAHIYIYTNVYIYTYNPAYAHTGHSETQMTSVHFYISMFQIPGPCWAFPFFVHSHCSSRADPVGMQLFHALVVTVAQPVRWKSASRNWDFRMRQESHVTARAPSEITLHETTSKNVAILHTCMYIYIHIYI